MLGLHPGIAQAVRPRLPPCLCALLCLSYFLFYFEDGLFVLNLVLPVFVLHLGYLPLFLNLCIVSIPTSQLCRETLQEDNPYNPHQVTQVSFNPTTLIDRSSEEKSMKRSGCMCGNLLHMFLF